MLNEKMEKALNEQLKWEAFSAYLYWSMSAYFDSLDLKGFASWMRVQALEEMTHAEKFFNFICERGGRVRLAAIDAPETEWDSPLAAFEAALGHEGLVTGRINKLVDLALAESDHAANIFLQWFVTEQVEEEATAGEIVKKLTLIGDATGPLFMLDSTLGQRVFTPPAAEGA